MDRCPSCNAILLLRTDYCSSCGAEFLLAHHIEAVPEAPPVRHTRLPKEEDLPFGGAFRSWGLIAGILVYIPSVLVLGYVAFQFLGVKKGPQGPGLLYFVFGGSFIPAGIAWMIVDSVQYTVQWLRDPRKGADRSWLDLVGGPVRLIILVVFPLGGAGLGPLLPISSLGTALLVGGLIGAVPGLLACLVITLILRAS